MDKKRVVILGAGFGGLYTYLYLKKSKHSSELEIILINKTNYFLFTPMLHEVATGGLNSQHVAEPLRQALRKFSLDFCQSEAKAIDFKNQLVETTVGRIEYDYLVLALGAETNFHDVPGAEKYSLELKNLADALKIRRRIIDVFELACRTPDPKKRRELLSFVVVGGGATGVELAAEIAEFVFGTMARLYKNIDFEKEISLSLIDSGSELLKLFHPALRKKAEEILRRKRVKILFNCKVREAIEQGVRGLDGSFIQGNTLIWVAGVKPKRIKLFPEPETDAGGRIVVDKFLRAKDWTNVFVLGDMASFKDSKGRPLPMLAQVAVKEAKTAALNILKSIKAEPLEEFVYKSSGDLISVGQWMALGDIAGRQLAGRFMWWLWRTVYLFKFASWSKRVQIAVDWTINLFNPRDTSKLE